MSEPSDTNTLPENGWAPLIIAVAPNGAHRNKQDHPALPMTALESATEAAACRAAGAAMIHLHVRDNDGRHSLDAGLYRDAIREIRSAVGDELIIQVTTEAVGVYTAEQQMAMVRDLRPEAISTALRELIPDAAAEIAAADFYLWTQKENIAVQFILYDAKDVTRFAELRRRGVLPDGPAFVLYVLGRYTKGQRSSPANLLPFLEAARLQSGDWHWSVCAFGPLEGACAIAAASLGGHVRVGLENNFVLNNGMQAPDNAALVRQVYESAQYLSRPVANADEARELLSRMAN